jgi:O-antigen ligase
MATSSSRALTGLALCAAGLPYLLAASAAPTSTFLSQWLCFAGFALWLAWVGLRQADGVDTGASLPATRLALLMWAVLVMAQLSPGSPTPIGQRLVPAASLAVAGLLTWLAARTVRIGREDLSVSPLLIALLVAGTGSAVIALIQVFAPGLADGNWIAHSNTPGRAIGNVRQPNQLATLSLWAVVALLWLAQVRGWSWRVVLAPMALLIFTDVLTASRTGTVGAVLLSLWGLFDRRWSKGLRGLLIAALPLYLLGWWGVEQWSALTGDVFFGDDQVKKTLYGDASSSRGKIWSNTLGMIAANPWTGTGAGAFNYVWTMTPFPDRPIAFFDHSHNLPLQLAAEFGIPMAGLVLFLLLAAVWFAREALTHPNAHIACSARSALMLWVLVGVHSLLEYPLWYEYFLLPAAVMLGWLTGLAARVPVVAAETQGPASGRVSHRRPFWLALIGSIGVVFSLWALQSYHSVAVIFEPSLAFGAPGTLSARIERGQASLLFGQHADYAEATMADQPEEVFGSFERPLFHLIDTRLMTAYARAWLGTGHQQEAQHVASRLREFRNPAAVEFFADCPMSGPGLPPAPAVSAPSTEFPCGPDPRLKASDLLAGRSAAGH